MMRGMTARLRQWAGRPGTACLHPGAPTAQAGCTRVGSGPAGERRVKGRECTRGWLLAGGGERDSALHDGFGRAAPGSTMPAANGATGLHAAAGETAIGPGCGALSANSRVQGSRNALARIGDRA